MLINISNYSIIIDINYDNKKQISHYKLILLSIFLFCLLLLYVFIGLLILTICNYVFSMVICIYSYTMQFVSYHIVLLYVVYVAPGILFCVWYM